MKFQYKNTEKETLNGKTLKTFGTEKMFFSQ